MPETVPYEYGMQLGQGYNSYLQQLARQEAVTVSEMKDSSDESNEPTSNPSKDEGYKSQDKGNESKSPRAHKIRYEYSIVKDYHALRESLNIGAGAAVSGWGQSGKVDAEYLDRSEFEESTLTYQVLVHSENQPSASYKYSFNQEKWDEFKGEGYSDSPQLIYGDRYISDFITGGFFFARFSIKVRNESQTKEIEEAAEAAFEMYGANVQVTQKMKHSAEKIANHSEVHCVFHREGGARFPRKGSVSDDGSESTDFLNVKNKADEFYQELEDGKHRYKRFALLQQYTALPNFDKKTHFKPHDYRQANDKSQQLFEDFSLYQTYDTLIQNIPKDRFSGGAAEKNDLENKRTDEIHKIRLKVEDIAADPVKALEIGFNYMKAERFYIAVINAIKTVTYIAQSRDTEDGDGRSDIILPELFSQATKLFEFDAYNFPGLMGTLVVSFGRSTRDGNSFGCLFGQRMSQYDGWEEESHFWVFPKHLESIANRVVRVSKMQSKNHIRLELMQLPKAIKHLFDFYVNVV